MSLSSYPFPVFAGGYLATFRSQPFLLTTPVSQMGIVGDNTLCLVGLDLPHSPHLDDSSCVSSLTVHPHSSCTASTCMVDHGRRSSKSTGPAPVVTTEEVPTDTNVRLSIPTSLPFHRIIIHLHRIITAASSNLFHPYQRFLHSTSRSSWTYPRILPLSPTSPLPSLLKISPSTIPRSTPQTVTMSAQASTLRRSPNPPRLSTSAPTRILPGQVQSDDVSCRAQIALSRMLVGILDRSQGVVLEPLTPLAVPRALAPSDGIFQSFAESVDLRETLVFLRGGYTPSRLSYEKCTVGNL